METPSSTIQTDFPDRPRAGSAAYLVQIHPTGPGMGRRYPVNATPLLIGRDPDCDVVLDDSTVAPRHARVQPTIDGCYVVGLGGAGTTFVNDQAVSRHKLQDGDYVRAGSGIFRFLEGQNVEAAYHEEVYRLTILDPLTGCHNRRYLMERLGTEMARTARYGRALGLLLLDVDGLGQLNATLGQPAGDGILRDLAALLRARVRRSDLVSRYGGDEFAVLLVDTECDAAAHVAEDIRRRVETFPFRHQHQACPLTVSVGLAVANGHGPTTAEEFIRQADAKLYEAKRAGGNRTVG